MATWIFGDVHGCARELELVLERLKPTSADQLVFVGDLFHRGPDPIGVMDILKERRATFVLGNHEHAVLRRCGLAASGEDTGRPARSCAPPALVDPAQLEGDGIPFPDVEASQRIDLVRFLCTSAGYFLRDDEIAGAAATPDRGRWCVLHAGRLPGVGLEDNSIRTLIGLRRLRGPGHPWWYEAYRGPELVVFGHTPSALPRAWRHGGRLVALGIDTGCVYGGRLTAYSPELDEFASVPAAHAYAQRQEVAP